MLRLALETAVTAVSRSGEVVRVRVKIKVKVQVRVRVKIEVRLSKAVIGRESGR